MRRLLASFLAFSILLGALLPQAAFAQAAPAHIRTALPEVKLSGSGSFRWYGLKIYDAELWASKNSFALDLRYARQLVGRKIAEASIDEIRQLGMGTPEQHKAWLASMTALFPDVDKDTRLTGIHIPGQPTQFFLNGAPLGTVTDVEFGPAFFAIWLHPKTSEPKLRRALLALP